MQAAGPVKQFPAAPHAAPQIRRTSEQERSEGGRDSAALAPVLRNPPVEGRAWLPPLLQLDRRALLLKLLLELLGVFLGEVLLDDLGGALDQVLGFLQAQLGGRADDLDHLDLLVAARLQDDVE